MSDRRPVVDGTDPETTYRGASLALVLIFVVQAFNVCDRTIMAVLVDDIRADLSLSDRQIGWLMGFAFAIVHALAGLPLARLADRTSRKAIISCGLFFWSAMTALAGVAQNFGQMFVARMGVGVGEAAGAPPSHALLADIMPPARRARALSLLGIGSMVGMGIGLIVGGFVNERFGWRAAFLSVGLPGVVLAGIVWTSLREPPRGFSDGLAGTSSDESAWQVVRYLFGLPSYRWLVASACTVGVLVMAKMLWEPTFLRRVYGMGSAAAGVWYFFIGPLPNAVGIALGGLLADRLGRRDERWLMWVGAISNLAVVPLSVSFLLWPEDQRVAGVPVAFGFGIFASLGAGMWSAGLSAAAQGLARPQMRALSAALWSMLFNLMGLGLGPLLVGDLSERLTPATGEHAVRYALAAASLVPLLASVCMFQCARTLRSDLAAARAAM